VKIRVKVDDRVLARARARAEAVGKTIEQLISEYIEKLANDDPERDMEEFRRLSGRGNSRGWRFNRDEIYERK